MWTHGHGPTMRGGTEWSCFLTLSSVVRPTWLSLSTRVLGWKFRWNGMAPPMGFNEHLLPEHLTSFNLAPNSHKSLFHYGYHGWSNVGSRFGNLRCRAKIFMLISVEFCFLCLYYKFIVDLPNLFITWVITLARWNWTLLPSYYFWHQAKVFTPLFQEER